PGCPCRIDRRRGTPPGPRPNRRQVSWLAGRRPSPPSRVAHPVAEWHRLAAYSCGGSCGGGTGVPHRIPSSLSRGRPVMRGSERGLTMGGGGRRRRHLTPKAQEGPTAVHLLPAPMAPAPGQGRAGSPTGAERSLASLSEGINVSTNFQLWLAIELEYPAIPC